MGLPRACHGLWMGGGGSNSRLPLERRMDKKKIFKNVYIRGFLLNAQ